MEPRQDDLLQAQLFRMQPFIEETIKTYSWSEKKNNIKPFCPYHQDAR